MEIQDILTLIQAVDEHSLTELKLEHGEVKLCLKREEKAPQILHVNGNGVQIPVGVSAIETPESSALGTEHAGAGTVGVSQKDGLGHMLDSDKVMISPLVGTFYNASSPEADSFVKVGDTVKKGQVLGIIEAMKLMNEIECEFDGELEAVLVGNEDMVEYGQPLFRIR